jgi:hypothetical protein
MGLEENVVEVDSKEDSDCEWTLCKHTFYDLSHVSPVVFMFMLKECYYYGMNLFFCNANVCCLH